MSEISEEEQRLAAALEDVAGSSPNIESKSQLEEALGNLSDEELSEMQSAVNRYRQNQARVEKEDNPFAKMVFTSRWVAEIVRDADKYSDKIQVLLTDSEILDVALARFPETGSNANRGR